MSAGKQAMGRTILGMLAGVVVMVGVILGVEAIGHRIYPPPAGLDPINPQHAAAFATFVAAMPFAAKAMLALAWTLGAFVGGLVAAKIARHQLAPALLVALVVMTGVVGMAVAVPHPWWLVAAGLLLPIPAALLATHRVRRRDTTPA